MKETDHLQNQEYTTKLDDVLFARFKAIGILYATIIKKFNYHRLNGLQTWKGNLDQDHKNYKIKLRNKKMKRNE